MRRTLAMLGSAVLALAACTNGTSTPMSPTPPAHAVLAVDISGILPAQPSFQLTATAHLSDGTTQDVTSRATWQSSDTAVATVSATGLVAALSSGDVEFRATYQGVTGAARTTMTVIRSATLSGIVVDASSAAQPIASARVQLVGGDHTFTDARGAFVLAGVRLGRVLVEVTKDGYQPIEREVTLDTDLRLTIVLTNASP